MQSSVREAALTTRDAARQAVDTAKKELKQLKEEARARRLNEELAVT